MKRELSKCPRAKGRLVQNQKSWSFLLDIVQSFTLLSYCIVSPIYISPICNVEIHYYEKIKIRNSLFFSLHMVSEPREKT